MSKSHVTEWQNALKAAGFDPGTIDGDFGPSTLSASETALWGTTGPTPPPPSNLHEIPEDWMPASSKMVRIIAHWTAGSHSVSSVDREHYHFIWSGDGDVVRGDNAVTANESTSDADGYAAHTKNCNSGSIGVSVACMSGATENPFYSGLYPMTAIQWEHMCMGIAQLCEHYGIQVSRTTVLSHGEVQETLGIAQSGKWDYTRLSWAPELVGQRPCGDRLRADVAAHLGGTR
jgi:lipocalin